MFVSLLQSKKYPVERKGQETLRQLSKEREERGSKSVEKKTLRVKVLSNLRQRLPSLCFLLSLRLELEIRDEVGGLDSKEGKSLFKF